MFNLQMDTTNDAFADWPEVEIQRILQQISRQIFDPLRVGKYQTIFDINGNDVGRWRWISQG